MKVKNCLLSLECRDRGIMEDKNPKFGDVLFKDIGDPRDWST